MSTTRPGKGWLGWLGRQVGYVRHAVRTDPAAPQPKVVYRQNHTVEQPLPDKPGVKLRRTVIDEVIVDQKPKLTDQRKKESPGTGQK